VIIATAQGVALSLLLGLAGADGGVLAPPKTASAPAAAPPASGPVRAPSLLAPVIGGRREQPVKYNLRPVPGGGYAFDDPRFSAQVARDGRVTFSDHHLSNNWKLLPVLPEPHPAGTKTLEGTVRKMLGERQRPSEPLPGEVPVPRHDPVAVPAPPPSENDRKWAAEHPLLPVMLTGTTLDLTDEYYRLLGEDPYRREKARFLAATFDVRLAMAARAEAADLRAATAELPERLAKIWADRSQPPAARRRIICSLWVEMRRDGKATAAAEAISTFVRTHLAAGTRDAYPPAELAACSEGQGVKFAPY
jgi:hypothetical protein